jgi:hypothetical protein
MNDPGFMQDIDEMNESGRVKETIDKKRINPDS